MYREKFLSNTSVGAPQSFERQVCNCACTYTQPKILCSQILQSCVHVLLTTLPCTPLYSLLANSSPLHSSVPSSAGTLHKNSGCWGGGLSLQCGRELNADHVSTMCIGIIKAQFDLYTWPNVLRRRWEA